MEPSRAERGLELSTEETINSAQPALTCRIISLISHLLISTTSGSFKYSRKLVRSSATYVVGGGGGMDERRCRVMAVPLLVVTGCGGVATCRHNHRVIMPRSLLIHQGAFVPSHLTSSQHINYPTPS